MPSKIDLYQIGVWFCEASSRARDGRLQAGSSGVFSPLFEYQAEL
jgi:hypothetical protein